MVDFLVRILFSKNVSNDCFYVVETTVEVSLKNEAYDENCKTGSGT